MPACRIGRNARCLGQCSGHAIDRWTCSSRLVSTSRCTPASAIACRLGWATVLSPDASRAFVDREHLALLPHRDLLDRPSNRGIRTTPREEPMTTSLYGRGQACVPRTGGRRIRLLIRDSGHRYGGFMEPSGLQPVATKSEDPGNGGIKPKPLQPVATSCRGTLMVRRGSTVRVRQRALRNPRKSGTSCSGRLARRPSCGEYGAVYGAFASASHSLGGSTSPLIAFAMPR
jgi:hypothetical protein